MKHDCTSSVKQAFVLTHTGDATQEEEMQGGLISVVSQLDDKLLSPAVSEHKYNPLDITDRPVKTAPH